ncbi:MAG TPA: integration host factor, actinobacterial type [Bacillota bacterium]|nr:integration host factor, actinobacterial type [Bacillota bacterium]
MSQAKPKPPSLTLQERRIALEKAQKLRKARAEIRRKLKEGELSLSQLLTQEADEVIARMRVDHVLQSLPAVGKKTSDKIMAEIGIATSKRLGGLSARQRAELLAFAQRFEDKKEA